MKLGNKDSKASEVKIDEIFTGEDQYLSWKAKEFQHVEKKYLWYLGLIVVFGGLIFATLRTEPRQYIAAILFALIGVTVAQYASRKPEEKLYRISSKFLGIDNKIYALSEFTSYYESDDYGNAMLDFVPKNKLSPVVAIPLNDVDKTEIEALLDGIIVKTEPRIELVDKITRFIRF